MVYDGRRVAMGGTDGQGRAGRGEGSRVVTMNCQAAHLPAVNDGREIVGGAITRLIETVNLQVRMNA